MGLSRRNFLLSGAAGATAVSTLGYSCTGNALVKAGDMGLLAQQIAGLFSQLPGQKAMKIYAPGSQTSPQTLLAEFNPDSELFCGSAFKAYALTVFLRQMEAGEASLDDLLPVNDSVWVLGSSVLTPNPPYGVVSGEITARTALEAMIAHSDNTATDMILQRIGADRVRQSLLAAGLTHSRIPDSIRSFFGYAFGAPDQIWQHLTWQNVLDLYNERVVFPHRPIINNVQTMVATPSDFVSFYSRALQGEFFQSEQTLSVFRSILALPDTIRLVMPLGVNGFLKGGSIDLASNHALCIAGGMFVPDDRWVYFGMILNWTDSDTADKNAVTGQFATTAQQIFSKIQQAFR